MTDAIAEKLKAALPHDGWASRKLLLVIGVNIVVGGFCIGAMTWNATPFTEAADLIQNVIGLTVVPLLAAMASDKHAEAKRG